jgi:hypothetical protein
VVAVCALAALLVGVAAVVDHRNEKSRGNAAQVREWYCAHDGTRCGGASSAAIERHWEVRERVYEVATVVLVAAAGVFAVRHFRRREMIG